MNIEALYHAARERLGLSSDIELATSHWPSKLRSEFLRRVAARQRAGVGKGRAEELTFAELRSQVLVDRFDVQGIAAYLIRINQ